MKFDLNWFTTIPGLLITGGVLLLVIALIIFIITSVKGKKSKKKEEEAVAPVEQAQPVQAVQPQTVAPADNGVMQPNVAIQPQAPVNMGAGNNIPGGVTPLNTVTSTDAGMVNLDVTPTPTIPMDSNMQINPMSAVNQVSNIQSSAINQGPVQSVVPTADEMLAVQQTVPVVEASNIVAPNMPVVSNVETISSPIANDPVTVSTQAMPNVDVVSGAPTVESLNAEPLVGVQDTSVSNVGGTSVSSMPNVSNIPVLEAVPNVSNTPVIEAVDNNISNSGIEVLPSNDYGQIESLGVPSSDPYTNVSVNNAVNTVPVVNDPVAVSTPTVVTPVSSVSFSEQSPVSIYGGVSPVVPNVSNEINQPHPIYGGANPLENTQSVPIVNIASDNSYVAQDNSVNSQVEVMPEVSQYSANPVDFGVQQSSVSVQPQANVVSDVSAIPNINMNSQIPQQVVPNVQEVSNPQYVQQPIQQQVVMPQAAPQQVEIQ
ncbi:MAG: hypothetical protein J6B89_00710 [Bacilli bacterium]|nr:hypothetical protein [Bacilli bacterium]